MPANWRAWEPYWFRATGMPIPSAELDEALSLDVIDTTASGSLSFSTAWAVDRGQASVLGDRVRRLQALSARQLADGDSTAAGMTSAMVDAVAAYGEQKAVRREAALPGLRAARRRMRGLQRK